jgi:hypothetical protein
VRSGEGATCRVSGCTKLHELDSSGAKSLNCLWNIRCRKRDPLQPFDALRRVIGLRLDQLKKKVPAG